MEVSTNQEKVMQVQSETWVAPVERRPSKKWKTGNLVEPILLFVLGVVLTVIGGAGTSSSNHKAQEGFGWALAVLSLPLNILAVLILQLRLTQAIVWGVVFAGLLIPVLNLVLIAANAYFSYGWLFSWCLIASYTLFFLLLRLLKGALTTHFRAWVGTVTVVYLVVLMEGVLLVTIAAAVLVTQEVKRSTYTTIAALGELVYFSLLVCVYVGVYQAYVTPKLSQYLVLTERMGVDSSHLPEPGRKRRWLLGHSHQLSALSGGFGILIIEVILAAILIDAIGRGSVDSYMVPIVLQVGVPAAWIVGVLVTELFVDYQLKVNSVTVCAVCTTLPLAAVGVALSELSLAGYLFWLEIPLVFLFWLICLVVSQQNEEFAQQLPSVSLFLLVVPVGVAWPLWYEDLISEGAFLALLVVFLFLGLVLCSLLWVPETCASFKIWYTFLKYRLKLFRTEEAVKFTYCAVVILGTLLLSYYIFLSDATWELGLGISGLLLLIMAFAYSIITANTEMYQKDKPKYTLLEILQGEAKPSERYNESVRKKQVHQLLYGAGGFLVPAIGLAIVIAVESSSEVAVIFGVFTMIGLLFLSCMFTLILEAATKLRQFGQSFKPYATAGVWLFLVIPFFFLLPTMVLAAQSDQVLADISVWVVGLILTIFFGCIAGLSVFLNRLFNRLEEEKFAKFCVTKLTELMNRLRVKADNKVIRALYDQFRYEGKNAVRTSLTEKTFFDVYDIDDDPMYIKEMLKVAVVKQKRTQKMNKQQHTCRTILQRICCCKPKIQTVVEDEGDEVVIEPPPEEVPVVEEDIPEEEPEVKDLEEIQEIELSESEKERLLAEETFSVLQNQSQLRGEWLMRMFGLMFDRKSTARGQVTLNDLRQFIRLVGLKSRISSARCDIIYTKATKKYDPGTLRITTIKITQPHFPELLHELAKAAFPHSADPMATFFGQYLYPHVVSLFPSLRKLNLRRATTFKPVTVLSNRPSEPLDLQPNMNMKVVAPAPPLKRCGATISKCISAVINSIVRALSVAGAVLFNAFVSAGSAKAPEASNVVVPEQAAETIDWNEIVMAVVTLLEQLQQERKETSHTIKMNRFSCNVANLMAIILHIVEIYTFCAVAFQSEIGWDSSLSGVEEASSGVIAETSYWLETFITAGIMSAVFVIICRPVVVLLRKGRLGLNPDFTKATFPKPQFFLEKLVSLLGGSLYLSIISALLSVFSCYYDGSQWILARNQSVECFTGEYWGYSVSGFVLFFLYYPTATVLYPNLMYQNKALDLKYDTSFLVMESQGKLLIAGASVFFVKELFVWLHLIVAISVCVALGFYAWYSQPCLVVPYNYWVQWGYLFPVWASMCALINYYTSYKTVAYILLVAGLPTILVLLIVFYFALGKKATIHRSTKIIN